jgi:SAM-dependent methyltransferase
MNSGTGKNQDLHTVRGFGYEWTKFDQASLDPEEREAIFESYFSIFPWERLPKDAVGFDLGCGSGRWAACVAPQVGALNCIDASAEALAVAKRNLEGVPNCEFHHASVEKIPLPDGSMDFGYSLGVLHHVPDTRAGIKACAAKLKPGAPFLLYLYYRFDNQPAWFKAMWGASDLIRRVVSRLPLIFRFWISQALALAVYWPLARAARWLERRGRDVTSFPLAIYREKSFYVMRTDAFDRFCTKLEQRFTRVEIAAMMRDAGLSAIRFSDRMPFWCAVGLKQ